MTAKADGEIRPRKKLIEVGLPLEVINREAAREKSIRHGHPSTLHLWWARRPLAAARAVLFAQLVDDPSSRPDLFPSEEEQILERKRLHNLIERLVPWEATRNQSVLNEARAEILKSCDGNPPQILDPFAGGGSIPLEAQRLGLEAHASDLNPIPVLINRALIDVPPKFAGHPPVFPGAAEQRMSWPGTTGLAEDVRCYGKWMRDEAFKRIGHLYPKAKLEDGTEATVIAWIWARTITCPNPACVAQMPLIKSFWLGKKAGKQRYVVPVIKGTEVSFEIAGPQGAPTLESTVGRTGAVCIVCDTQVPLNYIRAEGRAKRMGAQLMAIAAEGKRQRYYLPANALHEKAADVPAPADVPDAELADYPQSIHAPTYGMTIFSDLFTPRQLITLTTLSGLVTEARTHAISHDADADYADVIAMYCAFSLSKVLDRLSTLCSWDSSASKETPRNVFARQSMSMTWDFAETNPFSDSAGNLVAAAELTAESIPSIVDSASATVIQADAGARSYAAFTVSTDPPYYDNVAYANLADYFYVWLRRSLQDIFPELLGTMVTPKERELVADPYRHGSKKLATEFFEDGFRSVFANMAGQIRKDFPMTVYYAFKQAESGDIGHISTGWETLLEGMIRAGFEVTATWPVRTEAINRMMGMGNNALASSIVLACRVRESNAGSIDRRGFLAMLRAELPDALRKLQQSTIAPVDLAQSAIGPGMGVFTRYGKVTEPDGSAMRVRTALALINDVLAEVLSEQEGDFDADTRWCVKWFEQHQWDEGQFGTAETLAKAYNTSVRGLEEAGVIRARAGKAVLFAPDKLPTDYDPATDQRITVWEIALHVSRLLEKHGVDEAGAMLGRAQSKVSADAVKELSYLLYSIAERKKWSGSALWFNNLVSSWPDLLHAARKASRAGVAQEIDFEQAQLPD